MSRAKIRITVKPKETAKPFLSVMINPYISSTPCKLDVGSWDATAKKYNYPSEYDKNGKWLNVDALMGVKQLGITHMLVFTNMQYIQPTAVADYGEGASICVYNGQSDYRMTETLEWSGDTEKVLRVGSLASMTQYNNSNFIDASGATVSGPYWDSTNKRFKASVPVFGRTSVTYTATAFKYKLNYDIGTGVTGVDTYALKDAWGHAQSEVTGQPIVVVFSGDGVVSSIEVPRKFEPPYFGDRPFVGTQEQVTKAKYLCYKVWTGATEEEIAAKTSYEIHKRLIQYVTVNSLTGQTRTHTNYYGDIPESDWCTENPITEVDIPGGDASILPE